MLASLILASALHAPMASQAIAARPIEYTSADGAVCEGYVAYGTRGTAKRPVVLIVHDWDGLGEYEMRRARELAALGYVGFAVDVYGKGVRPQGDERGKTAGSFYANPTLFTQRLKAGFDAATALAQSDPKRVGAIGYCFGGGGVLQIGRAGLPVKALISFHGSVAPSPEDGKIKGRTLILHGDADRAATPEKVRAFEASMKAARRPVRVVFYPGAVHAFTVPEAGNDPSKGVAYNANADRKSFVEMKKFLAANLGR